MSSPEQTLKLAERSYRAGDFKTARRLAREVIEQTGPDGEIGERAAQLLKASGVDPLAIAVFSFTLALLLFLIVRYVL